MIKGVISSGWEFLLDFLWQSGVKDSLEIPAGVWIHDPQISSHNQKATAIPYN